MQGFDYEKAKQILSIPSEFEVQAMFAIGHLAPKESLVEELMKKEIPSSRKEVSEFVFEGGWR